MRGVREENESSGLTLDDRFIQALGDEQVEAKTEAEAEARKRQEFMGRLRKAVAEGEKWPCGQWTESRSLAL